MKKELISMIHDVDIDNVTLEDIEEILERFVQFGLAESVVMEGGEIGYKITEIGAAVYESQMQKVLN